jgi:flagellar basal body-associated protein FliL
MKIAKPLLLITTPVGLIGGIYEAHRLAGGLVFLFVALIALIGTAMGTLVYTFRKEKAEAERKAAAAQNPSRETTPDTTPDTTH